MESAGRGEPGAFSGDRDVKNTSNYTSRRAALYPKEQCMFWPQVGFTIDVE